MAPPSNLPRLKDITPDAVAREVVELVQRHVERIRVQLDPTAIWRSDPETAIALGLGATVAYLAEYARTGRDPEAADHATSESLAHERLADVCDALYSRAADPDRLEVPELDPVAEGGDPATSTSLVLVATWARLRLARGEPLRKREVAALASMSLRAITQLAADGEIRCDRAGRVSAEEARRWLAARGVPGFTDPTNP